jgi:hypothetical protein
MWMSQRQQYVQHVINAIVYSVKRYDRFTIRVLQTVFTDKHFIYSVNGVRT